MSSRTEFLSLPRKSVGEQNPVPPLEHLQIKDLPMWSILPYDTKYPVSQRPKACMQLITKEIGKTLYEQYPNQEFNITTEKSIQPTSLYDTLHDPYLRKYFMSKARFKRLVKRGLVTRDGKVKSHVSDYNQYRMYLYHLWAMQVNQLRKNEINLKKQILQNLVEAIDNGDNLCNEIIKNKDVIDVDTVLLELPDRFFERKQMNENQRRPPLVESSLQWKCYHDKLKRDYKQDYPAIREWLNQQTKDYRFRVEVKLNAAKKKEKKLQTYWDKIRENNWLTFLRSKTLTERQQATKENRCEKSQSGLKNIWTKIERDLISRGEVPFRSQDVSSNVPHILAQEIGIECKLEEIEQQSKTNSQEILSSSRNSLSPTTLKKSISALGKKFDFKIELDEFSSNGDEGAISKESNSQKANGINASFSNNDLDNNGKRKKKFAKRASCRKFSCSSIDTTLRPSRKHAQFTASHTDIQAGAKSKGQDTENVRKQNVKKFTSTNKTTLKGKHANDKKLSSSLPPIQEESQKSLYSNFGECINDTQKYSTYPLNKKVSSNPCKSNEIEACKEKTTESLPVLEVNLRSSSSRKQNDKSSKTFLNKNKKDTPELPILSKNVFNLSDENGEQEVLEQHGNMVREKEKSEFPLLFSHYFQIQSENEFPKQNGAKIYKDKSESPFSSMDPYNPLNEFGVLEQNKDIIEQKKLAIPFIINDLSILEMKGKKCSEENEKNVNGRKSELQFVSGRLEQNGGIIEGKKFEMPFLLNDPCFSEIKGNQFSEIKGSQFSEQNGKKIDEENPKLPFLLESFNSLNEKYGIITKDDKSATPIFLINSCITESKFLYQNWIKIEENTESVFPTLELQNSFRNNGAQELLKQNWDLVEEEKNSSGLPFPCNGSHESNYETEGYEVLEQNENKLADLRFFPTDFKDFSDHSKIISNETKLLENNVMFKWGKKIPDKSLHTRSLRKEKFPTYSCKMSSTSEKTNKTGDPFFTKILLEKRNKIDLEMKQYLQANSVFSTIKTSKMQCNQQKNTKGRRIVEENDILFELLKMQKYKLDRELNDYLISRESNSWCLEERKFNDFTSIIKAYGKIQKNMYSARNGSSKYCNQEIKQGIQSGYFSGFTSESLLKKGKYKNKKTAEIYPSMLKNLIANTVKKNFPFFTCAPQPKVTVGFTYSKFKLANHLQIKPSMHESHLLQLKLKQNHNRCGDLITLDCTSFYLIDTFLLYCSKLKLNPDDLLYKSSMSANCPTDATKTHAITYHRIEKPNSNKEDEIEQIKISYKDNFTLTQSNFSDEPENVDFSNKIDCINNIKLVKNVHKPDIEKTEINKTGKSRNPNCSLCRDCSPLSNFQAVIWVEKIQEINLCGSNHLTQEESKRTNEYSIHTPYTIFKMNENLQKSPATYVRNVITDCEKYLLGAGHKEMHENIAENNYQNSYSFNPKKSIESSSLIPIGMKSNTTSGKSISWPLVRQTEELEIGKLLKINQRLCTQSMLLFFPKRTDDSQQYNIFIDKSLRYNMSPDNSLQCKFSYNFQQMFHKEENHVSFSPNLMKPNSFYESRINRPPVRHIDRLKVCKVLNNSHKYSKDNVFRFSKSKNDSVHDNAIKFLSLQTFNENKAKIRSKILKILKNGDFSYPKAIVLFIRKIELMNKNNQNKQEKLVLFPDINELLRKSKALRSYNEIFMNSINGWRNYTDLLTIQTKTDQIVLSNDAENELKWENSQENDTKEQMAYKKINKNSNSYLKLDFNCIGNEMFNSNTGYNTHSVEQYKQNNHLNSTKEHDIDTKGDGNESYIDNDIINTSFIFVNQKKKVYLNSTQEHNINEKNRYKLNIGNDIKKSSSIFVGVIEKEKNESNLNNDIQDYSPIIIVHEEKVDSNSTQESNIYEKSEIPEEPIDLLCNLFGGLSLTVIKNNHDKTISNSFKVKEIHSITESKTRTNKFKNNVAKNKNSKISSRKVRKRPKVKSRLHTGIKSGSRLKLRSLASPPKSGLRNATQQNCRTVLGLSTTNYHKKAIHETNFSGKKEQMSFSKEPEKHGLPTEDEIIEQNSPQRIDFEMNHIKQNSASEEPTMFINRESLQINGIKPGKQQYLSKRKGFIKANKTRKYFLEEITAQNLSEKCDSEMIKVQKSAFKKQSVCIGRENLEKTNVIQEVILKDKQQNLSMRVDFTKTGNKHEFIPQEIPKQDLLEEKVFLINGIEQQFNLEKSNWQKSLDGKKIKNIEQVFPEVKQQDLFKNKGLVKTDKKQEFIPEEMTDQNFQVKSKDLTKIEDISKQNLLEENVVLINGIEQQSMFERTKRQRLLDRNEHKTTHNEWQSTFEKFNLNFNQGADDDNMTSCNSLSILKHTKNFVETRIRDLEKILNRNYIF